MLELVLNATKILFSKDVREGAASLVDLVSSMPEWRKGICTLEAKIVKANGEQARFLLELATSKMENLAFPDDAVEAFEISFREAAENAFSHACRKDGDVVRFLIDISETYASFSIVNPRKRRFSVAKNIERVIVALNKNPRARCGRGLIEISSLADELSSIENWTGLKAVFYSDRVRFITDYFGDLVLISLVRGMSNPSLPRRILKSIHKYTEYDILLSFAGWGVRRGKFQSLPDPGYAKRSGGKRSGARSTQTMRALIDAEELWSKIHRRFVVLEEPEDNNSGEDIQLPAMIVHSLESALDILNRRHLYQLVLDAIYRALDER
jgi:anti-sigma regulatory factor (Ser/Thr protein kinase)